jgi:hypothetical protein
MPDIIWYYVIKPDQILVFRRWQMIREFIMTELFDFFWAKLKLSDDDLKEFQRLKVLKVKKLKIFVFQLIAHKICFRK